MNTRSITHLSTLASLPSQYNVWQREGRGQADNMTETAPILVDPWLVPDGRSKSINEIYYQIGNHGLTEEQLLEKILLKKEIILKDGDKITMQDAIIDIPSRPQGIMIFRQKKFSNGKFSVEEAKAFYKIKK